MKFNVLFIYFKNDSSKGGLLARLYKDLANKVGDKTARVLLRDLAKKYA